jgi:predicted aspartyl protease
LKQSLTCIVAVVVLLCCLSPARGQGSQSTELVELEQLLSKVYLAYGGRDALAALDKNYTLIGDQVNSDDQSKTVHIRQLRKGDCLRIDAQAGDGQAPVTTVYDGRHGWKAVGKVVDDLEAGDTDILRGERDHSPTVLAHFQEPGYTFKLNGRSMYHAVPVYVIVVNSPNSAPVTVFVDENNYQVLALSFPAGKRSDGSGSVTLDYSQYRPAGGTMYPFKQTEFVGDAKHSNLLVSSLDTSVIIDDAQFKRPDKMDEVHLDKAKVISFEYTQKEILVKVRIDDGEPVDFLLDTAASQTVVDRAAAAAHLLNRGPNYPVAGVAGSVPTQVTRIPKLSIGDVELTDVQALILDLSPQTRQMGKPIAGILGANVLSKFIVGIDYSHGQITFNDLEMYKPPANGVIVPFAQRRGPLVRAYLNGHDVPFLIDTGAAFNNLPTRIAHNFLNGQSPHTTEGTGLDGQPVKLAALNVPLVKLGTQTVRNVSFTYSVEQDSQVESKGVVANGTTGVLGNPFWQNFVLTVDYKFERLILQPGTMQVAKQEIYDLIALGDNKLTVYRDFRAAQAAYEKALMRIQSTADARLQARVWGRIGNMRRVMAKDLNRPEQARIAYEYFSKAEDQAHRLQDRETEGRILADWSLLYLDNSQLSAAQQALQGAILYSPQDAQVNIDYAVYLYKMQMYPEMQKYIEKALFLDPTNWQALWYKLKLADMFGDKEQQKSILQEILKTYPWSKVAKDKLAELMPPPPVPTTPEGAPGANKAATAPLPASTHP